MDIALERRIEDLLESRPVFSRRQFSQRRGRINQHVQQKDYLAALIDYLALARANEVLIEKKGDKSQFLRFQSALLYEKAAYMLEKVENRFTTLALQLLQRALKHHFANRSDIDICYAIIKIGCGYSALGQKERGEPLIRRGLRILHRSDNWPETNSMMRRYLCEYFYEGAEAGEENLKAFEA